MKYTTNLPQTVAQGSNQKSFFPHGEAVLISITSPDTEDATLYVPGWKDILRLQFYDIINPGPYMIGVDEIIYPINEEQAKQIADFIRKHWDENIIVHCRAGISRSAAVSRLLNDLGWEMHSFRVHDLSKYNVTVYNRVKKHFPELLPIGA